MKTLRVSLINAGRPSFTSPAVSPPLGLLYLAAYARKHVQADFQVIDQRGLDLPLEEVIRQIRDFSPDIIGIRCLTANAGMARNLAEALRAELSGLMIVAGGPHASSMGGKLLEDMPIDVAVPGEGEVPFTSILQAVHSGSDLSHIPGIWWKNQAGDIIHNPGVPDFIQDIDAIPMPAYELIDVLAYGKRRNMTMLTKRPRYFSLFTSRGCPYRCIYCHSIFGKRFRPHSPERVVEEIQWLADHYGIEDFDILDDIFNMNADRVFNIVELLKKKNMRYRFAFPNAMRTDILTEEVMDALVDMGTYMSAFALETGSPRLQKVIGKNLNIEKYLAGVRMAARRRIFSYGFAMLGFPGETAEEMQMTVDVICNSDLHAVLFFTVTPFPGTPLFEQVVRDHPERLQRLDYEGKDYLFKLTANLSQVSDEELTQKLREANRRFYLNPRRIMKIIRDYPEFRQLITLGTRFLYLQATSKL